MSATVKKMLQEKLVTLNTEKALAGLRCEAANKDYEEKRQECIRIDDLIAAIRAEAVELGIDLAVEEPAKPVDAAGMGGGR